MWTMRVTVIPIVVTTFGKVHEALETGLEEFKIRVRIETIQTAPLLRLFRILRRVLET